MAVPAKRVQYSYDYRGRMVRRQVFSGTYNAGPPSTINWSSTPDTAAGADLIFLYDGWQCVAALKPDQSLFQAYVWGADLSGTMGGAGGVGGLVMFRRVVAGGGTETYFSTYDGNGNVTGLVKGEDAGVSSSAGSVSARYEYGPFGTLLRISGEPVALDNPFRFSTKYHDDTADLMYYGFRYYNPSTGRWLSRDPLEEKGGFNLYGFVYNNPQRYSDPLGLRIYITAPPVGGLDYTRFDDYVLNGFQRIIGDCAKLRKTPIIRQVETGFLFWKKTETRLLGWELDFTDQKLNCVCSPCWKWLKLALGDHLPKKDIYIHRGDELDNASEFRDNIYINENLSFELPTLDASGNVVWENAPFDVVLWHEVIGHGYRDLKHPKDRSNRQGGGGRDPTIVEENNARNCLRLQGVRINDRVPTYYRWKNSLRTCN